MFEATLFSATLGEDNKLEPPLGPLYIAAALEEIGWRVDFRDYQLAPASDAFDPRLIEDFLQGHRCVLMISCFVDMLPVVIAAAARIKAARPDTLVILGGPGPSARAKEIVEQYPQLDGIVIGEGEDTIKEWALALERNRGDMSRAQAVPGMVIRTAGGVLEGGARKRLSEAKASVRPAYHLVDWPRYSAARVVSTRGCPYACSFCDVAHLWGRKAVYRDVMSTVEEMIYLRQHYNCRFISIADDTFVLDRERVIAFCNLLIERDAGIQWGCFGRINLMSEALIALMAKAGCRAIFYGIDSGSPTVLKQTVKELKADSILPILQLSARYFELIEASFIWGYPFESYEDFRLTLELAAQASELAPKVNVQLHMLSPLPHSPMYLTFKGELLTPEPEDQRWLLLPALLLDSRAAGIRETAFENPHLFPGFFTFPTPEKRQKRQDLETVIRSMEGVLGQTLLDDSVRVLLSHEDQEAEADLLAAAKEPAQRIGTGLALGVMRRTRVAKKAATEQGLHGSRGPSLVRQRNDLLRIAQNGPGLDAPLHLKRAQRHQTLVRSDLASSSLPGGAESVPVALVRIGVSE
jgi:anaerobic magnesium-protoporphyrin IX monomethyl ester cyclase